MAIEPGQGHHKTAARAATCPDSATEPGKKLIESAREPRRLPRRRPRLHFRKKMRPADGLPKLSDRRRPWTRSRPHILRQGIPNLQPGQNPQPALQHARKSPRPDEPRRPPVHHGNARSLDLPSPRLRQTPAPVPLPQHQRSPAGHQRRKCTVPLAG